MITSLAWSEPSDKEVQFIKQLVRPGDLVFDVGALVGAKTDIYLAAQAGYVVCIDPQPKSIALLKKKYANEMRVCVIPLGLASKPGCLPLAVCKDSYPITTFSTQWQEQSRYKQLHAKNWQAPIDVHVTTLDAIIATFGLPRFCKIDVENFEYEVLKGLSHPIPSLSIEFHQETLQNTKLCLEQLSKLGYTRFNIVILDNNKFLLEKWVGASEIIREIITIAARNRFGEPLCGDLYALQPDVELVTKDSQ